MKHFLQKKTASAAMQLGGKSPAALHLAHDRRPADASIGHRQPVGEAAPPAA
ncbi:MAG: hypothetical protein ACKO01_12200 [Erythrobacter sp.]